MIQDSIDRDMEYCKQLVAIVDHLMATNAGRHFSGQEIYLLLAGIYLHGLGLQCNIIMLPEIQKGAEALGARFLVPGSDTLPPQPAFPQKPMPSALGRLRDAPYRSSPLPTFQPRANKESPFTVAQQNALRKNYHYLSAAWIEYANKTGETDLGPAAMTIPADLLGDLMDVCIYHTRQPITHCAVTFTFDPMGRKQFITALIRFAIEMHTAFNRTPLETLVDYPLNPRSAVYWWLHHRTTMTFVTRNSLRLTITLHPDDVQAYGTDLHLASIIEFQNKNAPVLSILRKNGIPLVIDPKSRIVASEQAERLPPEIVAAIHHIRQGRGPLFALAHEIRTWLVATRYEVSDPHKRNERTVDMYVSFDQGSVRQRVLITGICGQVSPTDIDAHAALLNRFSPEGWIISDQRVSDLARRRAALDSSIEVFHLADFLWQKFWGPYFDALIALTEKDHIADLYVDVMIRTIMMGEQRGKIRSEDQSSLNAYVDAWRTERGRLHITLLGDSGTGKTWFCRSYAYRQLKRYLKDPTKEQLPLLITLRNFTRSMNIHQLINEALLEHYRLLFVGSAFDSFTEMNRRGKLLIIFDGFDEMPRDDDYQTVVNNFWELAKVLDERSKIILTSCKQCFHWEWNPDNSPYKGLHYQNQQTIVLTAPEFEVLELQLLTNNQITNIITHRAGKNDGPVLAEHILNKPHLAAIARTPASLPLLLTAMETVSSDKLPHKSLVYLHATQKLLIQHIPTAGIFTSIAEKLFFLCDLSWHMIKYGRLWVHYSRFPLHIRKMFEPSCQNDTMDIWDEPLQQQTLLRRNVTGHYAFVHKSIAEYFVALKFAAELGCLHPHFVEVYCGNEDSANEGNKSNEKCHPFAECPWEKLRESFGAKSLQSDQMHVVGEFLVGMMAEDCTSSLMHIRDAMRDKTPEQVGFIASNVEVLLPLCRATGQ
jgi:GTPase SAR1 family protein